MAASDRPVTDLAFTREDLMGTRGEATFAGALSFMRRRYSRDLDGVDVAVTGVPFDTATTNRPGARFGPRAIRAASSHLAWTGPYPWTFDPFDRLAVVDYGDCPFDFGWPAKVPAEIETHARGLLDAGVTMLTLGGDHFTTYPILRAHADKHGPLSLIHFDAHADADEDKEGRIDHGTMFYHAARDGLVDPARSVQVGIRTVHTNKPGFQVRDAPWVHAHGSAATAEEIKRIVGDRKAYLTFDIDCLDPAFAPGTGTPVCGGLSTHQALSIIRDLPGINLVGMDVVEVAPAYDTGEITALAGASLALEFLCVFAESPARA